MNIQIMAMSEHEGMQAIVAAQNANYIKRTPAIRAASDYPIENNVAVIQIFGLLTDRVEMPDWYYSTCSYEAIAAQIDHALDNSSVKAILLEVNSGGGVWAGVPTLMDKIKKSSLMKPFASFINDIACSSAYCIAASTGAIYINRTSEVGSIGIFRAHIDVSKQLEMNGVKITYIKAGEFKTEGVGTETLSEESITRFQESVDQSYDLMCKVVGDARPTLGKAGVKATKARIYQGKAAVEAGLADGIKTKLEVLNLLTSSATSFSKGKPMTNKTQGEADTPAPQATAAEERVRVKAILTHANAAFSPETAEYLAYETSMSAEDAGKLLATIKAAPAQAQAPDLAKQNAFLAHKAGANAFGLADVPKAAEQQAAAEQGNIIDYTAIHAARAAQVKGR